MVHGPDRRDLPAQQAQPVELRSSLQSNRIRELPAHGPTRDRLAEPEENLPGPCTVLPPRRGPPSSILGAEPGPLQKSVFMEEEQTRNPKQRRMEGPCNRVSRCSTPFICSMPGSVVTDVDLSLPAYFPPAEQTIPTELEQLLPPPSPPGGPIDADDIVPLNDELVPADRYTVDNETPRDLAPETVRGEAIPPLHQRRTVEDPVQGTEISCVPQDLAQRLSDQLYEYHGCCRKCHEQREREHET
ncbi:hypothetical protein F1880_009696 [Penicillium rolfsii]|nr:hypothetical protein F1880_009696 [Penicillium rolfsii]